jgi:hypothetical protein
MKESEDTHKTVTIKAIMETDLTLTINVPIDWDDDRIYDYASGVDGGVFSADGEGSWYVSPHITEEDFDSDEVFIHTGEEYQM